MFAPGEGPPRLQRGAARVRVAGAGLRSASAPAFSGRASGSGREEAERRSLGRQARVEGLKAAHPSFQRIAVLKDR